MNKKFQKISALVAIACLFAIIKANSLFANYAIVPDLTIESVQTEGQVGEPIELKIIDANASDTKVWLPLPEDVSLNSSQNEHGSVTYDAANHQLVIDWTNQEEENRFVTLELSASEAGSYQFQASVMRAEQKVTSQPLEMRVIENEQPEVIEEEKQEEVIEEVQQKTEGEENQLTDKEQADTKAGTTDDPRIGLPIKEIFPDPNMAAAVAEVASMFTTQKITIDTPLTQAIIDKQQFGFYASKNITDVTGIDIFAENMMLYDFSNNHIKKLPDNFFAVMREKRQNVNQVNLSNNQLGSIPLFGISKNSITELNFSNNKISSLNDDFDTLSTGFINLSDNLLTNLPPTLFKFIITTHVGGAGLDSVNLRVDNNLLPNDGEPLFNELMLQNETIHSGDLTAKWFYGAQKQLGFNSELPVYTITKSSEIENDVLIEKLRPYLAKEQKLVSDEFPMNLLDFVNKDGQVIDITTYFKDGKSIKNEDIYVKVQSRVPGIYDVEKNTNNTTFNQALLKLKIYGNLTFVQAPSQLHFGDDLEVETATQVFPLQSFNAPLSVQDDKGEKSTWKMTAKMTKELTSASNHVLTNALHYRIAGEDSILNKTEINIYSHKNTDDHPFNISDMWMKDDQNGLFLVIKAGEAAAEEYTGTIEWKLQDVPENAND